MALQFVKRPDGDAGHVIATARLCRTEDDRLVPDSDPDARWLYCTPGTAISRAEAERYGLLAEAEESDEVEKAPESPKERRPAANKQRARAADK